jgi:methionyl-tRNA formyltransferase
VAVIARLARDGRLASTPQPATGVTHAGKIDRAEAAIDWSNPAEVVDRQIRAFDPVPGVVTTFDGNRVKIWRADWAEGTRGAPPGTVLALPKDGIVVACGHGELRIEEMQPASSRRMSASAFAAGHGVVPGKRFGPLVRS